MKIRNDFVTNSSSSSFIIARKGDLTEKQKEIILDFVLKRMLGKKIASTQEELDKFIEEEYINDEKEINKMKELINNGFSIYQDGISFEEPDAIGYLYQKLWKELKNEENFIEIDTDLMY